MVSVICSNALSYVVHDSDITDPGEILDAVTDRKSTRLNSSHRGTSYAVFCLNTKIKNIRELVEVIIRKARVGGKVAHTE